MNLIDYAKEASKKAYTPYSKFDTRIVSPEDRQNSLTTMIELALETTLKVGE